jgi:hypothetical protein
MLPTWLAGKDCVLWLTLKAGTVSAVMFRWVSILRWVVKQEAEMIGMAGDLGATTKQLLVGMFSLRMSYYLLRLLS